MNRKKRESEAHRTLEIIRDGQYSLPDGTGINISEAVRYAVDNSVLVTSKESDAWLDSGITVVEDDGGKLKASGRGREDIIVGGAVEFPRVAGGTVFEVCNKSAVAAARDLVENARCSSINELGDLKRTGFVGILNFASARNPGGGFLHGSRAQEESLAISSALYATLLRHDSGYYSMHKSLRQTHEGLYTDTMIYSPDTPFFRDDDLTLTAPFNASVVTCAAVNCGAVRTDALKAETPAVMEIRIRKILHAMARSGQSCIVLGAYGCGVFKNDVHMVAHTFARLLTRGGEFCDVFRNVVFAIYTRDEHTFLHPFRRAFADVFDGQPHTTS